MRYLSTRVCTLPKISCNSYQLSYDYNIWNSTEDFNKIKELYFDEIGWIITNEDTEHFQPKSFDALNYFEKDFYPCVIKVCQSDYPLWVQANQFEPKQKVYNKADLVSVGYDIMDLGFMSIDSHGVSAKFREDICSLNKFGLYKDITVATNYLKVNLAEIPEHP